MTVKMMKVVAAVSVAVCLGTAPAQQTISLNLGQQGTSGSSQAESDTVKVQGRGVGENKTAALKDAYRDAIERAVGLYVDAETVAKNDEIVKEQVLTQSNAYITDYRELDMKPISGDLVQIRILATVKKQALTTKLTGVMPAQTVRIDNSGLQNVHAQLVTKEKRAEDGAALLKNALDGLNPMQSLMVARIRPETQKIITAYDVNNDSKMHRREVQLKSNQVMLRYLFEVKLDREKYFSEFMPHLKKVLDQLSLSSPKEIRLTELTNHADHDKSRAEMARHFIAGNSERPRGGRAYDARYGNNVYALYDPVHAYSILWQGDNWEWAFSGSDGDLHDRFYRNEYCPKNNSDRNLWQPKKLWVSNDRFSYPKRTQKVLFAMITSLNADCSNGKVSIYELEKSMFDILAAWHKGLLGNRSSDRKRISYNILLLSKDGDEIGVYPWQIPNDLLTNVKFAHDDDNGMQVIEIAYATPFVGCFGESLLQWRDFVLEKDQLQKVASIKIESAE